MENSAKNENIYLTLVLALYLVHYFNQLLLWTVKTDLCTSKLSSWIYELLYLLNWFKSVSFIEYECYACLLLCEINY